MRKAPLMLSVLAVMLVGAWVFHADAPTNTEAAASGALQTETAAMKVYIDPATGRITDQPSEPQAEKPLAVDDPLSRSSEGLEQVPAPGGGVMIDLQGRFQNVYTATVDPSGQLTAGCETQSDITATSTSEKE